MNLAGELVLGRNQLMQTAGRLGEPQVMPVAQRIDLITSELQAEIMQTRMQPLDKVFGKFPRLVRDLCRSLNKKVELRIEGREVELDKTIVEALGDPLVHIIRNSLDHGVELPDKRVAAGKPPEGLVWVRAYHEAGQVNIEIKDDGAGIDLSRVKDKAVRQGIISQAEADIMSEQAAMDLIFRPGFSTAEQVSEVSGRGVGMDVVRSNLEKLGGVLDMQSKPGQGSTIRIKLPLTMAIIACLIVRLGEERFAIPQINLIELVRVRTSEIAERIVKIGGREVLRLREQLLSLIRLGEVLETSGRYRDLHTNELMPDRRQTLADRRDDESADTSLLWRNRRSGTDRRHGINALNILVLSAGELEYGLVVDELEDTEEIVVKPLGRHLKEIPAYAGATIMGDGRVAPILDVIGLSEQADLLRKGEVIRAATRVRDRGRESEFGIEMEKVLVFKHATVEYFAVPIPLVARIERIDARNIEASLGYHSMQYRGGSLRLIMLDRHLPVETMPETDKVYIIVFEINGKEIGLVARELVDEKMVAFKMDTETHRQPGVMGSLIVDRNTVILLDIFELVDLVDPDWSKRRPKSGSGAVTRVLLVEDSDFFRNKVAGYLREAGMEVLTAENGRQGLDVLAENPVDIVITDIEMPVMDGYQLVREIRSRPEWANLRVAALSSLAGDDDIDRGLRAGVNRYLVKLDRSMLIDTVLEMMEN